MRFGVLGPLAVTSDTGELDLGGPRQRSVIARLLVADGAVVGVDRLLDDLWSGEPPPQATGALQAYVSKLRRLLEPGRAPREPATVLVSAPPGYALRVAAQDVDASRFTELLDLGGRALAEDRPTAAGDALDDALALWRGDAYADFADEPWARPAAVRLNELRLVAREQRLTAALAAGRAASAVPELEQLADEHPLRESLGRLHALALYRTGRQGDALAVLRALRRRLADELGIDPGPAVAQLEGQVLAQASELEWSAPREAVRTGTGRAASGSPSDTGSEPASAPAPDVTGLVPAARGAAGSDRLVPAAPAGRLRAHRQLLDEAEIATRRGGVRTAFVVGEPGIGKTHLADALAGTLETHGWMVARGRCPDAEGVPALWPWQQVLVPLLERSDLGPQDLAPLDALLGGGGLDVGSVDVAEARFRQHDAVARALARATEAGPLLIVLDDLQWADVGSVRLLVDLAAARRGGHVLVVATVRDAEIDAVLADALGRLAALGALRLDLVGLPASALREIAESAGVSLSSAELERLAARTGGNPFFARETMKLAAAGGSTAPEVLAPTVQDALRRRLARLPEVTGRLLSTAAVLGSDIDPDLLVEVSGIDEDEVLDALDGAVLAGVLRANGPRGLRFGHDLIRETAAAALPPLRRARLHARAAAVLERRGADPAAIAYQAVAAGPAEADRAIRAAESAAAAAARRVAFDEVARWLRAAVDVAARSPIVPKRLVSLQLALVRALLDAGDWTGARRVRVEAVRTSDDADDSDLSVQALLAIDAPTVWTLHDYAEVDLDVVGRLERALAGSADGESSTKCLLLGTLAAELYDGSDNPRCDELSGAAVAMARRIGEPSLLARTLNHRYHAVNMPRFADDMLAIGTELVGLGQEHSLPATELLGQQIRALVLLLRGQVREADAAAGACPPLLTRLQLPPLAVVHHTWLACRLLLDGRFPEAAAGYRSAFAEQRDLGLFGTEALVAVVKAAMGGLTGCWDGVEADLPVLEFASPHFATSVRIQLACDAGRTEEAYGLAAGASEPTRHDWAQLAAIAFRADAVLAAGCRAAVARSHAELLPFSGGLCTAGNSFCFGPADHYLARTAAALGRQDEAERHREAAARLCRREGLDWWSEQVRKAAREGDPVAR